MVWASRRGKLRQRDRILDGVGLEGALHVLDVGCGRGLLLVGAAKRMPEEGVAIGVDLWQSRDLAGNQPAAAMANARIEGVERRVRVVTGDMRRLPIGSGTIDVVVSSLAIHNVPDPLGRRTAIQEIARVTRQGGTVIIQDISHVAFYASTLGGLGFGEVTRSGLQFRIFPPARFLVARKS
jgi:arsenite methyltransferase